MVTHIHHVISATKVKHLLAMVNKKNMLSYCQLQVDFLNTKMKKQKAKATKKPTKLANKSTKPPAPKVAVKPTINSNNSNNSKVMPLGDRVLIKPFRAEQAEAKNEFGIIIPETVSKELPGEGRVVAVGEGKYEGGKLVPVKVKVGDKVIFSKYGFDEVKVDSEDLYILKEDNILAVIK